MDDIYAMVVQRDKYELLICVYSRHYYMLEAALKSVFKRIQQSIYSSAIYDST